MVNTQNPPQRKILGLNGKSDFESAKIDEIADYMKDVVTECKPYFVAHCPDSKDDKEKLHGDVFKPAMEKHMPVLEKLLKESGSGFFVKGGESWVDFYIANFLETFEKMSPKLMEQFKELKKHQEKVYALPQLKKYIEGRKKTDW